MSSADNGCEDGAFTVMTGVGPLSTVEGCEGGVCAVVMMTGAGSSSTAICDGGVVELPKATVTEGAGPTRAPAGVVTEVATPSKRLPGRQGCGFATAEEDGSKSGLENTVVVFDEGSALIS